MRAQERKRKGKKVFMIGRQMTREELEEHDLLQRIEALEQELQKQSPSFQVPEPPKGLQRRKTKTESD